MHHITILSFLFITLISYPMTDKTWTGGEDHRWDNPNNWDPPGVPSHLDNVHIPPGSPDCNVENTKVCNNLNNEGNLNIKDNADLECGDMNNSGNINIGKDSKMQFENGSNQDGGNINLDQKGWMKGNGDFTNEDGGNLNMNGYGSEVSIDGYTRNNGNMNFNNSNCKFDADNLDNNGNIQSPSEPEEFYQSYDININCRWNFNNNSQINGGEHGANVNIKAGNLNNNSGGRIEGGNGVDGGNVNITADRVNNRGDIMGGNGAWNGGKVFIETDRYKNFQGSKVKGGDGSGGYVFLIGRRSVEDYGGVVSGGAYSKAGGSVYMFSDSIHISLTSPGDTIISRGYVTKLIGRAIYADSLNHPMSFYQPRIVIATTYDGFIDFSSVTTHWGVFSSYSDSEYVLQSNNRMLPDSAYEVFAFGITPEDTSDADTTANKLALIKELDVTNFVHSYDTSGSADTIYMTLINLGPGTYKLHYSVNSERGWVDPVEDSVILSPFTEIDTFFVTYEIPDLPPDSIYRDILRRKVWVNIGASPQTADTIFSDYYYLYGAQMSRYLSVSDSNFPATAPPINILAAPNPFNSSILIQLRGQESPVDVKIYSISGKIVYVRKNVIGSFSWRPSKDLPAGVYFVSVPKYSIQRKVILVK